MGCEWPRGARSWGAAAVVVLAVSGCGADEGGDAPPPAAARDSVVDAMVMPVTAYMPSTDEYLVLQKAHGMIVRACMAGRGFDWEPSVPYAGDVFGRRVNRRYRYVVDRDAAAEHGYHMVPSGSGPPPEQPPLSDAELSALSGDDARAEEPGGCMGEAIQRLSGGLEHVESGGLNLPYPVAQVNFDSFSRSQEDPRVRAALGEWSACMAEQGHQVRDPVDYLPAEFDLSTPEPSTAEVEMALRDIGCQERTGVVRVWFEVDAEYQRKMLDERAEVFAQVEREGEELFRRAAEVVESAGG